ncbi:MAG: NUDIX hydrolase [Anaerolineaceae bacterium]|nr:NUDIX hydrolase [Anaerolineaceae bacterium]
MKKMLPMKEYYASLPRKRMAAGCLFLDAHQRVLLVKPNYKDSWEIPGGVMEEDESPRACAKRETLEEIGLDLRVGRLLVIDYCERVGNKTESLMFIFDGGILETNEINAIKLQPEELVEFEFFLHDQLPEPMFPMLSKRVQAAWRRVTHPGNSYLENQKE